MPELPSSLTPAPELPVLPGLRHDVAHCKTCRQDRPKREFTAYKLGVREYRHKTCNRCRAEAHRMRPAMRRNIALIKQAKSQPCQQCRQVFPEVCMELAPRRPLKYPTTISWRWYTEAKMRADIAQCDVVCEHCRRMREAGLVVPSTPPILANISSASSVKSAELRASQT